MAPRHLDNILSALKMTYDDLEHLRRGEISEAHKARIQQQDRLQMPCMFLFTFGIGGIWLAFALFFMRGQILGSGLEGTLQNLMNVQGILLMAILFAVPIFLLGMGIKTVYSMFRTRKEYSISHSEGNLQKTINRSRYYTHYIIKVGYKSFYITPELSGSLYQGERYKAYFNVHEETLLGIEPVVVSESERIAGVAR